LIAATVAIATRPISAQSLDEGRDSLRQGQYAAASRILARVGPGDDWAPAQRFLVLAFRSTGKYQEAEDAARRATAGPNGRELWNTLGEVLYDRGRVSDAEGAFKRAISEHASDSLTAALNLAILHYERGETDAAMK
jgi:Flp pilus assembly protein TadD